MIQHSDRNGRRPYFENHGPHIPIEIAGYVICDDCGLFLLVSECRVADVRVNDRRFRPKLLVFGREFASNIPFSSLT